MGARAEQSLNSKPSLARVKITAEPPCLQDLPGSPPYPILPPRLDCYCDPALL